MPTVLMVVPHRDEGILIESDGDRQSLPVTPVPLLDRLFPQLARYQTQLNLPVARFHAADTQ